MAPDETVYYSDDQIKKGEMGGGVWRMRGRKDVRTRVLVGKLEQKRQMRRPRRTWENNIKMHF
jgi:hypothetical protein